MVKIFILLFSVSFIVNAQQQETNISAKNSAGNKTNNIYSVNNTFYYNFEINNLKIPIDYTGVIAAVNQTGGSYDGRVILNSGGFLMSGKSNGVLWGNGQATSLLIENYIPGKVNSDPHNPKNLMYVVKESDPPFGAVWQSYKDAVSIGADFYDGNNDGLYTPVDLNGNEKWDLNEDKPDILGDVTAWCVYNDGDTSRVRFPGVLPQGIEIQQTAFAYARNTGEMSNVIYFRYRIINRGTIANVMDSVYFSLWSDPEINEDNSDLAGCDTLLNAGYCYSNMPDHTFGDNPPALLVDLVQGPVSYIPGVTFIDNNNNGIYDEGVDTPKDTAYSYRGRLLGVKKYNGAKNLAMTSFIHCMTNDPVLGDPNTSEDVSNYIKGRIRSGAFVNPCTWSYGIVVGGVSCAQVNPRFFYSGNPVDSIGWINKQLADQRQMVNTGPFKLELNKPVDIIAAYIAGRGDSPISSVTTVKGNDVIAQNYYKINFPLTDVTDDLPPLYDFNLSQNYPNPFNPSTVIKYSISEAGSVKLLLYNLLGQAVKELDSGFKSAGVYSVDFNAGNLSSGVYFYRLTSTSANGKSSFSSTRKMMVIK